RQTASKQGCPLALGKAGLAVRPQRKRRILRAGRREVIHDTPVRLTKKPTGLHIPKLTSESGACNTKRTPPNFPRSTSLGRRTDPWRVPTARRPGATAGPPATLPPRPATGAAAAPARNCA